MGGSNVKNTMVERVLQVIAPHPCFGCGKIGTILCDDCKYDIRHEPFYGCILCGKPQMSGICNEHTSPIGRAFTVGQRIGTLERIINALKFRNVKAASGALGQLLDEALPLFPAGLQIVPIPTARSHVRQRGYDQVELIARHLSTLREVPINAALERITNATQHTVGKAIRKEQSKSAFALKDTGNSLEGAHVLLLDDIVTTGATLLAAAGLLKEAGATIWVATLAYQALD